ncbi:hypothetical protein [Alcanivorax sp.]|jgi:hypothetical protein|uniref:hypothetical protein n=1 Tax=Alcanivorax sp. TaxID=1872427 RepID=UPI0032D92614
MKITLPLTLGLCALIPLAHADEELAPPDVDFYAEAQMIRADMDPYGFDTADGLNINIGLWLNSVELGKNSRFGLEAGFVSQSDVSDNLDFVRPPEGTSEASIASSVRVQQENSLTINGLTLGVVWQSPYWLYLKGGGYLYDFKLEQEQERIFLDPTGAEISRRNDGTDSNDQNGIAPFATVGVAVPILDQLFLTAQYQYTNLESEAYGTLGIGLRYTN